MGGTFSNSAGKQKSNVWYRKLHTFVELVYIRNIALGLKVSTVTWLTVEQFVSKRNPLLII